MARNVETSCGEQNVLQTERGLVNLHKKVIINKIIKHTLSTDLTFKMEIIVCMCFRSSLQCRDKDRLRFSGPSR